MNRVRVTQISEESKKIEENKFPDVMGGIVREFAERFSRTLGRPNICFSSRPDNKEALCQQ
jgi:hypothetical protein